MLLRNLLRFILVIGMLAGSFISTSAISRNPEVTTRFWPDSRCPAIPPMLINEASRSTERVSTQEQNMIQLTRLNNHPLAVNSDLIKFVEQSPDTVITLVNGEKIVVRESSQEVLERVVEFRRSVLQGIMLWWDNHSVIPSVAANEGRSGDEK